MNGSVSRRKDSLSIHWGYLIRRFIKVHLVRRLSAKRRMRQHAVVFVDVERDQSTHGGDAVKRVEEEPLMFRERHHTSIMEFENFSSVKAKTRRSTPVAIRSSTWAFTFSTPASANTTGVVSEGVAPR